MSLADLINSNKLLSLSERCTDYWSEDRSGGGLSYSERMMVA